MWSGRLAAVKNGNKLFVRRADVATSTVSDQSHEMSLRDWAKRLARRGASTGVSAAGLVLEDRAERAGR